MTFPFQKQIQDALDGHFSDKGIDQFAESVKRDENGNFVVSTTNGCIVGEKKGQQILTFDQESEKFSVVD